MPGGYSYSGKKITPMIRCSRCGKNYSKGKYDTHAKRNH